MISPSNLKAVFDHPPSVKTSDYFLKTHIHLEGYVKRVMLIGLRLNGVQYLNSEKVVDSTYIQTANLIEKVLWLIDASGSKQGDVVKKLQTNHIDFFKLKELVMKFSAPYRNRLAHGTIAKLHDQDMIDHLCHINLSFIKEFEHLLKSEYKNSAYSKPKDFGAGRGNPELIEETVKRLKLGSIVKDPLSLTDVKKQLASTKYPKP